MKNKLKRDLGFFTVFSIGINIMIASGIFFKQGRIAELAGSKSYALAAWIIAGIVTLLSALPVAEIASQIPKTGGLYEYFRVIYGKKYGFVVGWVITVIEGPTVIASSSYFCGTLLLQFLGINTKYSMSIAFIIIFFLTFINFFANKVSGTFAIAITVSKIIPIAALLIYGLFIKTNINNGIYSSIPSMSKGTMVGLGAAVIPALYAFDGWAAIGNISGEVKKPTKTVPKAIVSTVIAVLIIYVLTTIGIQKSISFDNLVHLNSAAPHFLIQSAFGVTLGKVFDLTIIFSLLGALNSHILVYPRVAFEMATKDNYFFSKTLKKLSKKSQVPIFSILWIVIISVIMIMFAGPQDLSDWGMVVLIALHILIIPGVFILRKKPELTNTKEKNIYRMNKFLYPLIPILAIVGKLIIFISIFVYYFAAHNWFEITGIFTMVFVALLGFIIYPFRKKKY